MRVLLLLILLYVTASTCLADRSFYSDNREKVFHAKVESALKAVTSILDTTRHPVLPEDSQHTYDDKYELVEVLSNAAIASSITIFEKLGLNRNSLTRILAKVQKDKKPVTLHFHMDQNCEFDKQTERMLVISETEVERSNGGEGLWSRLTTQTDHVKVKRMVQEYHFSLSAPYRLFLKVGDDEEIVLQSLDEMETEIIITGGYSKSDKRPPLVIPNQVHDFEINLTWLFEKIILSEDQQLTSGFSIDRLSEKCKTPRRNEQVNDALVFRQNIEDWKHQITDLFQSLSAAASQGKTEKESFGPLEIESLLKGIFSPIVPLFEGSTVLPQSDFELFLSKHDSTLDEFIRQVQSKEVSFLSEAEILMVGLFYHLNEIFEMLEDSIEHVENMLRDQLVQAIGKTLKTKDFDEFLGYYSKKVFGKDYAPTPFSYAVRRGNHYPDGVVSIESEDTREPVDTTVRRIPGNTNPPISIPVDAATYVEIQGDRFIHGWIQHRWGTDTDYKRTLVARAHQFSSFLIVLGVMGESNTFIPKDAIILQNKDEVLIPLLTNVLPSAKEFKDSIASLSPEQKAFAEAYRKMQLESSVFGVCIVQIKPQLERLLNLPDGALTKEIQLTQDLMSLFVEYQIPSDLLSFDGSDDANVGDKVAAVKQYTKAVMDVIENSKKKQLEEEKQKAKMREKMRDEGKYVSYDAPSDHVVEEEEELSHHKRGAYSLKAQMMPMPASLSQVQQSAGHAEYQLRKKSAPKMYMASNEVKFKSAPEAMASNEVKFKSAPEAVPEMKQVVREEQQENDSSTPDRKDHDALLPQEASVSDDFTLIPKLLDSKFEEHDKDGALKSTIIKAGRDWIRARQENFLVASKKGELASDIITSEKNKAMDLLTAISRSGSLPIESSELHIIVAVSHCFEKEIMDTIIVDNINPIEKMRTSMMMIASVIHGVPEADLIAAGAGVTVKNETIEYEGTGGPAPEIVQEEDKKSVEESNIDPGPVSE